ncbi:YggT family protein [Treponema primitia]|uniref:YggT family protein n=1 Tax=Treponema primitia TaxID=88058 RepID=UPI003980E1F3
MAGIMNILGGITSLYMILIFIRIMLTWFTGANYGKAFHLLSGVTDPYLNWFRRFSFLRVANLDLTPVVALALLTVVNNIFLTLGRYGTLTIGIILSLLCSVLWSVVSFVLGFSIVVLVLRLIAYLANRDVYHGFWRIIDTVSAPILYRINRMLFGRRLVRFMTGILTSLGVLLALRVGLELLVRFALDLLVRLPF